MTDLATPETPPEPLAEPTPETSPDPELPAEPARAPPGPESGRPALRFELDLDPEQVPRLLRHPALARGRVGRPRSAPETLVWQDTADGALAAAGIAHQTPAKGEPQLLRWRPLDGELPCPGTAGTLLPLDAKPIAGPLVALAGFSGRRTRLGLSVEGGTLEASLRIGKLHSLMREMPAARLLLEGPAGPVLELARELGHGMPAHASWPEIARALAGGGPAAVDLPGMPDLSDAETIEDALAATLLHLTTLLLAHAPGARADAGPMGVHQMRVALRRLRSALRVFRPALDGASLRALDAGLRSLASSLGQARDWDVFLAGIGAELRDALPDEPRLAALLRAAEQQRLAAYASLRAILDGGAFRDIVFDAVQLGAERRWRSEVENLNALVAPPRPHAVGVLQRRWRRLLRDGEGMERFPAEQLHNLRLDAKRLRYVAELFAPLWAGRAPRRFLRRLAALQGALGLSNDASVAVALVRTLPGRQSWAAGVVEGWALSRAAGMRAESRQAWDELTDQSPFWIKD